MSTTLPSPPATPSPPSTKAPPSSDLAAQLDALLESYLALLDTYTTLRTQLSTQFSSGFLSLAHANRNAAAVLGAGRRFGQDGYDERMKALRGVRIERLERGKRSSVEAEARSEMNGQQLQGTDKQPTRSSNAATGQAKHASKYEQDIDANDIKDGVEHQHENHPENPSNPDDQETHATLSAIDAGSFHFHFNTTASLPHSTSTTSKSKPRDPLTWFTALPPQPLRQTQSHFTSTISTTIPELLTTISKMEALERQIWDVRAQLGILDEYKTPHGKKIDDGKVGDSAEKKTGKGVNEDVDVDIDGSTDTNETVPKHGRSNPTASLSSPSRRQHLVSRARPSEPRSRVLKMD